MQIKNNPTTKVAFSSAAKPQLRNVVELGLKVKSAPPHNTFWTKFKNTEIYMFCKSRLQRTKFDKHRHSDNNSNDDQWVLSKPFGPKQH